MKRGYTLPLVLLVALAATVLVGTMFQRHAQSRLASVRQVRSYQDYHTKYGAQAVLRAWYSAFSDLTDEQYASMGRLIGRVDLSGGATMDIELTPQQGLLLVGPAAGVDEKLLQAARLLGVRDGFAHPKTRAYGPKQVDAVSADPAVLIALAEAWSGEREAAEGFAREVVDLRERDELKDSNDLARAAQQAEIEGEALQGLLNALVLRGTFYRSLLTFSRPGTSGQIENRQRFVGWVDMTGGRNVGLSASAKFLTFERLGSENASQ
ncbi:MAG: hypothetical protein AAF108_10865 [Planctomycetota bacterium]